MEKKIGTIIKTYQTKRTTQQGNEYDVVIVWYRDENGDKKVKIYDRPIVSYYLLKDHDSDEAYAPPLYIPEDKVERIDVYSDMLFRDIAVRTNTLAFYDQTLLKYGKNAYSMRNLFRHNWVYDADMNLQDRIISKFQEEFEPDPNYQIHKAYFDIEVDLMPNGFKPNLDGTIGYMDFPDEDKAPCPVTLITLINGNAGQVHTFIVKNKENKSQKELFDSMNKVRQELLEEIHREDDEDIVDVFTYIYDTEEEAIEAFFEKVHDMDPDYLCAWNECYDAITLMNRLSYLYSKKEITRMNAKNWQTSIANAARTMMYNTVCDSKYLIIDNIELNPYARYTANKKDDIGKRIDFFNIFDGINWFDSEYNYALIHMPEGKKDSYKLDFIAEVVLGKHKLEFGPGITIKTAPWMDYTTYYKYNVRDVILLYLLEKINLDIDTLQRLSEITNTRKEKVFAKSVSLANFVNKYARMEHYVMNCNKNQRYNNNGEFDTFKEMYLGNQKAEEPTEEYAELFEKKDKFGAVVSDPMLNAHVGEEIFDDEDEKNSMHLFRWVGDQDLSSLYPSIIRAYNLDSLTEVGKFFLRDDMLKKRLKEKYDYYGLFTLSDKDEDSADVDDETVEESERNAGETNDLGPTITDEIISQNWCALGEKFFMLPTTEELYDDIDKIIKEKNKN